MKEKYLFFDLDGTLTDSQEGIINSVRAAAEAFGIDATPQQIKGFIGPPLTWSFPHFFGLSDEETQVAIGIFRERYSDKGKFENRVYEGIFEALTSLRDAGYRLVIATSKPEFYATQIADHFGLTPYFDLVAGSSPDESGGKEEVIRDAIARLGNISPETCLMIGDREHDIEGAHAVGMRCVAVLWGYGSQEEFTAHRADEVVETPEALVALLTGAN